MSSDVTIQINRDPAFWAGVAAHPAVAHLMGDAMTEQQMLGIVNRADVTPLASEHGGFLFVGLDPFHRIFELHTLYRPEGWGREVHAAAKQAFNRMFAGLCEIIVTHQMHDNPRSQPPRSFGFRAPGDFAPSMLGSAKTWFLTRDAWAASPGGRSSCQ